MEGLLKEFINERVWAVVGASMDPDKLGHQIFRDQRTAGYAVYGVNPRGGEIRGSNPIPHPLRLARETGGG